jgi:hypothetical protein
MQCGTVSLLFLSQLCHVLLHFRVQLKVELVLARFLAGRGLVRVFLLARDVRLSPRRAALVAATKS